MIEFDHIAVSGATLAQATSHVEAALGAKLQAGGEHAVFHTHNTLLGLERGLYLEAIAANPEAPQPERARWFDLDRFEGTPRLSNWICRCDDLDATLARLPDGFGAPVDLARGDLRWRMAVPRSGILPFDNSAPALIQWQTDLHPAKRLARSGLDLTWLEVRHPQVDQLEDLLAPVLSDDRIRFVQGDAGLQAGFAMPDGAAMVLS